jgi:hypothetical protein
MKADVNPLFLNKTIDNVPSMLGRKHSEETKRKIREGNIGVKRSSEARGNNSAAQLKRRAEGYTDSEETRLKKSLSHIGLERSQVHCDNIAKTRIGRKHWINHSPGEARCTREWPGEGFVQGKKHKRKREPKLPFECDEVSRAELKLCIPQLNATFLTKILA